MANTNGAKPCPFCQKPLRLDLTVQYSLDPMLERFAGDLLRQMPPIGSNRWVCDNCLFFCYFLPAVQGARRVR